MVTADPFVTCIKAFHQEANLCQEQAKACANRIYRDVRLLDFSLLGWALTLKL